MAQQVVLVTGAGRGVGRAVALAYGRLGAHVVVNCFRSVDGARETVRQITDANGSAELIRTSVASRAGVEELFTVIRARHGRLDVLVNNAVRAELAPIADLLDQDWDRALAVNLHGARWCAELATPLMAHRPGAAIVNVSSISAGHVVANSAAVGVSKAAVEALNRYLAVELAPAGIRVNSAACAGIDNEALRRFPDYAEFRARMIAATPLGRLATEADLRNLIMFLASERAAHLTGQVVLADGGLSLGAYALGPPTSGGRASGYGPRTRTLPRPAEPQRTAAVDQDTGADAEKTAVAVVGMGIVVPGADGTAAFWQLLTEPRDVFTEPGKRFPLPDFWAADRAAPDRTYARVAGYVTDESGELEVGWLRRAAREAWDGVTVRPDDRRGAYFGAWAGGSQATVQTALVEAVAANVETATAEATRSALRDHLPYALRPAADARPDRRIRRALDGIIADDDPLLIVDTACASSLNAVDLAAGYLLSGRCDVAICGGVESLDPTNAVLFAKLGGLSPTGAVRALDAAADGTLFSDGAAALVLKTLARAHADGDEVLGVLDGCGSAADGRGRSIAAPNPEGQRRALGRARAVNNLSAGDVDWIIAHATGTTAGDRSELETIAESTTDGCPVSATKAVVGHTGWAAGATSLIHALLALRAETIPPQYRFGHLPDDLTQTSVRVPDRPVPLPARRQPRTVGVSAFGFGGTNAHLLVSDRAADAPRRCRPPRADDDIVLVGWSAHLAGLSDRAAVHAWLTADGPGPERSFGRPYPLPSPLVTRLPARTAASIDPGQVMALEVAQRFVEENGELWASVTDTTGVIGAHTGLPYLLTECALRTYAHRLRSVLDGCDASVAEAVRRRLAVAAERLPVINEDSQPGALPNVLASRVAQRYDLHGVAMALDGGPDSVLWAVDVAGDRLRSGELDLALVLAVDANSTSEAAHLAGLPDAELAEGAVLLGLARRQVAERQGWPLLAHVETAGDSSPALGRPQPAHAPSTVRRLTVDAALALVQAVASGSAEVRLAGRPSTPVVWIRRPRPRGTHPEKLTQRYVPALRTRPAPSGPVGAAVPPLGVILTDLPALDTDLMREATAADTLILSTHPAVRDPVRSAATAEPLDAQLAGRQPHVRIVVGGEDHDRVSQLHELAFRTLRQLVPEHDKATVGAVLPADAPPFAGLFSGLTRSVVLEYPSVRAAVVLTDESGHLAALRQVGAELDGTGTVVVHRRGALRRIEVVVPAPLPVDLTENDAPLLPDAPVVVASGGTGGLATVLLGALRHERRPTLWILGSSDLRGLNQWNHLPDDPGAARRVLIRSFTSEQMPLPKALAEADHILLRRRAAAQLHRLRRLFGPEQVRYLTCDVTNPAEVHAAASTIYRQHNHIDLLLHAAGRSSPHALPRKELAEFRRLRDIKTAGHRNLRDAFDRPTPRLWCNVGSLVGMFGEAGDLDYASGNDALSRAGRDGWRRHDRREVTIGFPLWSQTGLAGPGTLMSTYLARRRLLTAITNAEGVAQFRSELRSHRAGGGASCYLGDIERKRFSATHPGYIEQTPGAYLRSAARAEDGSTVWECPLDQVSDAYLHHHRVAARPTVPGTFMLEMAAEAALALQPERHIHGFRECSFDRFIRPFTGRFPTTLQIRATPDGVMTGEVARVRVELLSVVPALGGHRPPVRHFSTVVLLGRGRPPAATATLTAGETGRPAPDPYYEPLAGVALTGFFHNTVEARVGDGMGQARWRMPEVDVEALAGLATPALLICATMRTAALVLTDADGSPVTYAPRRIARVDLPGTPGNDLTIAARHPNGVRLCGEPAAGRYQAATPTGELIVDIDGAELIEVAGEMI